MWGGAFARGPAEWMEKINRSIGVDKLLHAQDIKGSRAHAKMLAKQGIITRAEGSAILKGLATIEKEIGAGTFVFKDSLEDIHMNIEARLAELIGEPAGKLHTARSRNDQVATDLRLWVRDAIDSLDGDARELQAALIIRAEEFAGAVMPGFTHLQTAQPVTLGHHLLAYVEMLGRDRARFAAARATTNESPLGAAALAGTSFPLDRDFTAKELGFARSMSNSHDAVGSRDFALEFLAVCAICATHLSRLAEEFILWSSAPFGFIALSESYTSGSSIMPQKRNPDAAELVRAKTGKINGDLVALLTVMKGLPLAYNKDLQEDKLPVFDAFEQLTLALKVMRGMAADFTADRGAMLKAAQGGYSTATDLADYLVRVEKMPFRRSHHVTAKIVALAQKKGKRLDELSVQEMQSVHPTLTKDVLSVLGVEHSVASRTSFGGTAPANVKAAVKAARKRFL